MTTYNHTVWSLDEIERLPLLGTTVYHWRRRNIRLYQHPTEPAYVVSVGVTFDRTMQVCAIEPKAQWKIALAYAEHGKVYVSE